MAATPTPAAPKISEVAEGVFAYVQPDGTWFINNTGIIVGPDTALMIDQTSTERRGRMLMDTVAELAGDRPVQALVNTHSHGDHTFGNFLVPAGTSIIAHERCRTEVILTGTAVTAFFQGPDWGQLEIRPPMVTFTDRLTLWSGQRPIELLHFGTPAHTTNDIIAHLAEERVVFTGDLVFAGGTPFALQGSVVGWLQVAEQLAEVPADTLVPGHGPVCGPEEIGNVRSYLHFVLDAARRGREAGLDPLRLARELELGPFADLSDPERIVGNLHRAYADLEDPDHLGKPLALPAIIQDMMAYHGGPITSCA
jgi:cyclase